MGYICLQRDYYQYQDYSITSFREEDIFLIKEWRNAQIDILRQKEPLTDKQQISYYENIVLPLMLTKEPSDILFSYLHQGECIGYGGLTHIDWIDRRAEISFLLSTSRIHDAKLYEEEFTIFLTLLKKIAFAELELNRLFTETFDIRPLHVNIIHNNGFRLEGILREHVRIQGQYVDLLIHGYLRSYFEKELFYDEG
jgi:RimJ/RimL family protein N-acetyltransferase